MAFYKNKWGTGVAQPVQPVQPVQPAVYDGCDQAHTDSIFASINDAAVIGTAPSEAIQWWMENYNSDDAKKDWIQRAMDGILSAVVREDSSDREGRRRFMNLEKVQGMGAESHSTLELEEPRRFSRTQIIVITDQRECHRILQCTGLCCWQPSSVLLRRWKEGRIEMPGKSLHARLRWQW